MVRSIVALLCLVFAGLVPCSAGAASAPALAVVGKNAGDKPADFGFRMGEVVRIRVGGDLVDKVKAAWTAKTPPMGLYLGSVHIADLKSPPRVAQSGNELLLDFPLVRDAEDDSDRKAWDSLFRRASNHVIKVRPALAIGGELPLTVSSAYPFQFSVAPDSAIWLTLGAGLATLLVAYWYLAMKTPMLYDAGSGCYSLGKSQMAFWGLLVLLSFVGIWVLTGTMERIPPQVLILLGISGVTGLSSVVIGDNKKTKLQKTVADQEVSLAKLEEERKHLEGQAAGAADAAKQATGERLATVKATIASTSSQVEESKKQLQAGPSQGFWRDICDDGSGLSFHRLQVVLWTLVLGAVFVGNVAQVMSMPEFSDTLLVLMGISNGTYLGFKIPEKQ